MKVTQMNAVIGCVFFLVLPLGTLACAELDVETPSEDFDLSLDEEKEQERNPELPLEAERETRPEGKPVSGITPSNQGVVKQPNGLLDGTSVNFVADVPELSQEEPCPVAFGGTDIDAIRALALDPEGHVVAVGEMRSEWTFGEETVATTVQGGATGFALSFDFDGTPLWGRVLGGKAGHTRGTDVAICPTGRVVMCGAKQDPLTHGSMEQTQGGHGVFVAEWKPDGTPSWLHTFEGSLNDDCGGIAIEQNLESPYVGHTVVSFVQDESLHLARFNYLGERIYEVTHGYGLGDLFVDVSPIEAVQVDGEGGVWVAGMFESPNAQSLGGEEFVLSSASGVFLAKYDMETGAHLWSGVWSSPHDPIYGVFDQVSGLEIVGGRVVIAGSMLSGVDFGDGPLHTETLEVGPTAFIAAFELNGTHAWSRVPTSQDGESPLGIRSLSRTWDEDLVVLSSTLAYGGLLQRRDPVTGTLEGEAVIEPGATSVLIDSEGMAVLAYNFYNSKFLMDPLFTSLGYSDIALNRVPMP